jgi:hypothetical protein
VIRQTCAALALLAFFAAPAIAAGLSDKPQGVEVVFVDSVSKDLNTRFPTPADAEKAGYFRYTNEDNTGAISYANLAWQSSDPQHPSQLWYSVDGKLLGADFSVLTSSSPNPPNLWGINPSRWTHFGHHVHYILAQPDGSEKYGATSYTKFVAAGGDPDNPQPATLVKMGIAKDASSVKRVFLFPAIWDLELWVTPNPLGAFAEKNPLVKPSKNAATMSD